MANFKPCVRKRRKDGLMAVYIRITHNRGVAYIKTDKLVNDDGIGRNGEIRDRIVLRYCLDAIDGYHGLLNNADIKGMSAGDLKLYLENRNDAMTFGEYAQRYIERLINNGQLRSAKIYQAALRSFQKYLGGDVRFDGLTRNVLRGWMNSLEGTKRAQRLYPICMRQVFRDAYWKLQDVEERLPLVMSNPWDGLVLPKDVVAEQRAIPAEDCRRFFSHACGTGKGDTRKYMGRDVAFMSFCLAGMNSVDIMRLRKGDYDGRVIRYHRSKTRGRRNDGAYFEIRVPQMVKDVMSRYYASKDSKYLFWFAEHYADDKVFNTVVNKGISLMCDSIGLERCSLYAFRHSWATIAQNDCGATLAEVGFALNHSGGHKVTRGYVKIDFTPAWELNDRVLDFVFFSDKPSKNVSTSRGYQAGGGPVYA